MARQKMALGAEKRLFKAIGFDSPLLNDEGLRQSLCLAEYFSEKQSKYRIEKIYSSDLTRTVQTARFIANALGVPVIVKSEFREVNNGALAGMDNSTAERIYLDLYWKRLEWNEKYPCGESPGEFYEKISSAWKVFYENARVRGENAVLVTRGGVIQVILSLLKREKFSNKKSFGAVSCCDIIRFETATAAKDDENGRL